MGYYKNLTGHGSRSYRASNISSINQGAASFGYNEFFTVEGTEKVIRQLKKLDDKLTRNTINRAFRKASRGLVKTAKSYALMNLSGYNETGSKPTGNLSKSIGYITGRSKSWPTVYVGPKVKKGGALRKIRKKSGNGKLGHYASGGWYGHFVEYGIQKDRRTKKRVNKGAVAAKPFMNPAIRQHKSAINTEVVKALEKLVLNQIKK